MKATIIYPRGMKPRKKRKNPDTRKLKGADAGKIDVKIEEANEDGRNDQKENQR